MMKSTLCTLAQWFEYGYDVVGRYGFGIPASPQCLCFALCPSIHATPSIRTRGGREREKYCYASLKFKSITTN